MRVDRKKFISMLNATKPALGGQGKAFSFREGYVRTFNDEMFVEAEIPDPIEGSWDELDCTVPSQELLDILKTYRTKEVIIEQEENQIVILSGKSEVGINTMESDPIPFDLDEIEAWDQTPSNFKECVTFCIDTASDDLSKIEFCDVACRNGTILSTDGYRMTRCIIDDIGDFAITKDSAKEIIKYDVTNFHISDKWIFFSMDDKSTIVGCRLTVDNIPEIDGFFEAFDGAVDFQLPNDINEIVDRLVTLSPKDIDPTVQIKLTDGEIEFDLEGRSGWINEVAAIKYSGEETMFNINPKYIRQKEYGHYECTVSDTILYIRYNEYIERLVILYN